MRVTGRNGGLFEGIRTADRKSSGSQLTGNGEILGPAITRAEDQNDEKSSFHNYYKTVCLT
jgi:hypothetical protein